MNKPETIKKTIKDFIPIVVKERKPKKIIIPKQKKYDLKNPKIEKKKKSNQFITNAKKNKKKKKKKDKKNKSRKLKVKCAPKNKNETLPYTCYTAKGLHKMKNIWNKKHPDRKITSNRPRNIWKAFTLCIKH